MTDILPILSQAVKLSVVFNERFAQAKQEYLQRSRDIASPLEQLRSKRLSELEELRIRVTLEVSDRALLLRILVLLVDQMTHVYEARTEQELKVIAFSIAQIQSTLQQNEKMQWQQTVTRFLVVAFALIAFAALIWLLFASTHINGLDMTTVLPILQIPIPILVWSAIGSFAAMLYRFNNINNVELQDPLKWLFMRPLTGIVMGSVAYLIFKIGLLSIVPGEIDVSVMASAEILWVVAFMVSFSDRLADSILRTLIMRFGGDRQDDILSMGHPPLDFASLPTWLDELPHTQPIRKEVGKSSKLPVSQHGSDTNLARYKRHEGAERQIELGSEGTVSSDRDLQ